MTNRENERLKALSDYNIMDTEAEEFFDNITKMASIICDTPIALVSLVDDKRQWFKSKVGLEVDETPKEISFCQDAIKGDDIYEIENALTEELYKNNPLVTDNPNIRFYAGMPLKTPNGLNIGTLCVIDSEPRKLDDNQKELLRTFAKSIISQLELMKTNLALEDSKNFMKEISEVSGVGSWRVDLLEQTVFWDETTKAIHEVQPDFVPDLGTGINFYKEGYSRDTISRKVQEGIEKGKPWDVELIIITATGKEKWVRAKGSVEFKNNQPVGLYGTFQDISNHVNTVELIKRQSQELEAVIKSAEIGIWNWNPESGDVEFSDTWKAMLGYTPTQFKNVFEEWAKNVHPDDIEACNSAIQDHIHGKTETFKVEFRMRHKNGNWKWILSQGNIIERDENGDAIKFIGTHLDIDYRKKKEEEIKKLQFESSQFFNLNLDFLCIANSEGYFEKINPAWTHILGWSEKELTSQPFANFVHPDDLKATASEVDKLNTGQKTLYFKNRYRTKSGEYRWLSWVGQEDISTGKIYAAARDITNDFELAEAEKKNLLLAKDKEIALESAKQKETFLANMSHEIRTPMNGIVGLIDMLIHNTSPSDLQQEYLETIKTSSHTLLRIINDILDYSKLEAGKVTLKSKDHNIHTIVHQVKNLFKPKAIEKNIEIISEYSEDMPEFVKVDNNRLNQVLSNIVSNAIKFCNGKDIKIKLSKLSENKSSHKIKIEVIDQGIGLTPEEKDKLFKSFSQLDNSSTKKVEGTGLGLAIAKQISELMGGEIGVDSEKGKGSSFWFTFNAERSVQKEAEISAKNKVNVSKNEFDLNVLLVDDKNVNLIVARTMLMKFGCIPETATNGKEALEKFEEGKYDLILMDIQMPEMDGVEATERIKSNFENVPPIVALTANAMEGDKEKYLSLGLDDYLAKPITLDSLQQLLGKWFPD